MSGFVGAQHEFHNAAFVQGWADRFVPTPPRIAPFDLILERVSAPGLPNAHVLELGLGPGYMARHILERNPGLSYEGLDFSEEFFDVARKTIGTYMPRVKLTKADLMDQAWLHSLSRQPGAIVSTWGVSKEWGIMPRWPTARSGWRVVERDVITLSRAFHCRPRSGPGAGDRHLFGTSASAATCSCAD